MTMLRIERAPRPDDMTPEERRAYEALPAYPKFGVQVSKWRDKPRTPENIKAHAEALFSQLRTLQRAEWKASLKAEPDDGDSPCVSGTVLTDGEAICRAIRQRHASALAAALAEDHKRRTDKQVGVVLRAALGGVDVRGIVTQQHDGS